MMLPRENLLFERYIRGKWRTSKSTEASGREALVLLRFEQAPLLRIPLRYESHRSIARVCGLLEKILLFGSSQGHFYIGFLKMASQCWPSKSNRSSIRYWWVPLEVQSFEPNTFLLKEDVSIPHAKSNAQSETKVPHNRVSTAKFISAVAGIWDYVGQPANFRTDGSLKCHDICQKDNLICYSGGQRKHKFRSTNEESFCNNLTSSSCFSTPAKSNFEDLKTIKKRLLFASCNRNVSNSFICKNVQVGDSHLPVDSHGIDKVASLEVSNDLANPYESTTRKNILTEVTSNGSDGTYDNCTIAERNSLADLSANWSEGGNITSECGDVSSGNVVNLVENVLQTHGSLYSSYTLQPLKTTKEAIIVLRNPSSGLRFDCNMDLLTDCTLGQCQQETDSSCAVFESSGEISASKDCNVRDNSKKLHDKLVHEQESSLKHWLSLQDKIQNAFSKNRHAIAGALAGALVSLCLHPVDTVKTVIQANGMGQTSSYLIVRRIISEKGILGLYRGIASNIASSAPISAIYTFTYESVKGALLPHLPKFYTYESLKQLLLASAKPDASLNTLQTITATIVIVCLPNQLVCGGLAGSTAALFTTPFDVVKTRLQTQDLLYKNVLNFNLYNQKDNLNIQLSLEIRQLYQHHLLDLACFAPGTLGRYNGVLHALQEIAREEGLQGLYRGLTPRLAMYVSQGAIFFASYEFLKAVFALQVPRPPSQVAENKQKADDLAPSRMHKLHS
ncbi:S-adenosylmethionine carrier 1, chloroplastic/mitochondrial [Cocos nucifera]|uniref:S-adenosylmethionine carrier 1, chloroplastic/mitochondrial n=1 Tax=Cocos nucifera TaxID=13894 RepID=A0A8K0IH15_COCNU|nr:S-adenosylmethionine carrier 1, chloroplastic/mitochondrial [Cocos nucifera]